MYKRIFKLWLMYIVGVAAGISVPMHLPALAIVAVMFSIVILFTEAL